MSGIRSNRTAGLWVMAFLVGSLVQAQETTWAVNAPSSLAWWQVNPHRQQMWATTCPEDPTWHPGEGADQIVQRNLFGAVNDTTYARHALRGAATQCAPGVTGTITTGDTSRWLNVRGAISVRASSLVTGLSMRDVYTRRVVLETDRYPEIRFVIDSLVGMEQGEPMRAIAVGVFELRGVREPMAVPVSFTRSSQGLRVRAAFDVPVRALVERYHVSRYALALALQSVWKSIEMGVDVVLTANGSAVATK